MHSDSTIVPLLIKSFSLIALAGIFCSCLFYFMTSCVFAFEEDPIGATQSPTVKVPRDFDPDAPKTYPAQPKYEIEDTDKFVTQKPVEEVEEELPAKEEEKEEREEPWFFWF